MARSDHTEDLEDSWKLVRPRMSGGRGHARVLAGKQFGYLRVIERHGSDKHGASLWTCRCELCGKTKAVTRPALLSGRVKSCGCLKAGTSKEPTVQADLPDRGRRRTAWHRLNEEG